MLDWVLAPWCLLSLSPRVAGRGVDSLDVRLDIDAVADEHAAASSSWFRGRSPCDRSRSRQPIRSLPHGSMPRPADSASSATSRVVSRIVSSPITRSRPPPRPSTRVLRNRSTGKFSTSKKSAERRWLSRWAVPVSMLAASIATSTHDLARSPSSSWIAPVYFRNRPRTFEDTMWRIEKPAVEWVGSMFRCRHGMCSLLFQ